LLTEVIDTDHIKPYYKGIACIYRAYAYIVNHSFDVIWLKSLDGNRRL